MAVINFMVVPPFAESRSIRRPEIMLVNRAPRGLHTAHAAELANVILARDQGHDYGQESGSAERLSHGVLHCPSPSLRRAQAAPGLFICEIRIGATAGLALGPRPGPAED